MCPARSCVYTISLAFSNSSRYRSSLACSTASTYLRLVMSRELITTPATAAAMYFFIQGPPFPPPIGKETGLYKEIFYRAGRTSPTTVPEVRSLVAEHALSRPRSPLPKPAKDAWQLGQGRPEHWRCHKDGGSRLRPEGTHRRGAVEGGTHTRAGRGDAPQALWP